VRLHTTATMTGPLTLSDGTEVPATAQPIEQDSSALVPVLHGIEGSVSVSAAAAEAGAAAEARPLLKRWRQRAQHQQPLLLLLLLLLRRSLWRELVRS